MCACLQIMLLYYLPLATEMTTKTAHPNVGGGDDGRAMSFWVFLFPLTMSWNLLVIVVVIDIGIWPMDVNLRSVRRRSILPSKRSLPGRVRANTAFNLIGTGGY